MRAWLLVATAIACNAAAQLALKAAAGGAWSWWLLLRWPVLLGLALYALSFVLTLRIFALFPLSVISPLMAGGIFALISAGAWLLFDEPVSAAKLAGMALILAGMALLARSG